MLTLLGWIRSSKERVLFMENQEIYQRAEKRAEAKITFYCHLTAYVAVNILLIITNLITSSQYLWFKWPLIGWSIGIFIHAFRIYAFPPGSSLKKRIIEKELEKSGRKEAKS